MKDDKKKENDILKDKVLLLLAESKESSYSIAMNTGISEASIGNYRNGKTKPQGMNAVTLLNYLSNKQINVSRESEKPQQLELDFSAMARSNEKIANAVEIMANSNAKLADNTTALVENNSKLLDNNTVLLQNNLLIVEKLLSSLQRMETKLDTNMGEQNVQSVRSAPKI